MHLLLIGVTGHDGCHRENVTEPDRHSDVDEDDVQPLDPLGVPRDVDGDDPAVDDGELDDAAGPPARRPHQAGPPVDERERHARRIGTFTMTAFCAVERDEDDPRRPSDYRGNELFWHKRGYERQHDMFCRIDWRETGATEATSHRLRYWLRPLERA